MVPGGFDLATVAARASADSKPEPGEIGQVEYLHVAVGKPALLIWRSPLEAVQQRRVLRTGGRSTTLPLQVSGHK
jgi:hypothetical protein